MLDPEKIADAPRHDIAYAGVAVLSRYGKRREFETMMAAIDNIIDHDPTLAGLIVEMFCNSKLGSAYTVKACHADGPCSPSELRAAADALDRAFTEVDGGHNGVTVDGIEECVAVDPNWPDDLF